MIKEWIVQVLGVDGGIRFESMTHGTEKQARSLLATFENKAGYVTNQ